ncbi:hypothetical protein RMSM_03469 [Rhodopirellula maiorica SM1]|uniref:Uncharacterized protein n=1 Tax=Rhodopirellula maiorica SM1 TaxID=1265738 RepID=M5RJV4_9BACT|nr:hypothetical protein RMSM_03469 [Rhodopirellula maiorica SM1]
MGLAVGQSNHNVAKVANGIWLPFLPKHFCLPNDSAASKVPFL